MENSKTALDIIRDGKNYILIEIAYDLDTQEAKIVKKEVIADNIQAAIYNLNKLVVNKLYGIKE